MTIFLERRAHTKVYQLRENLSSHCLTEDAHGSYVIEGKGGGVSTIAVSVRKVRPFPTSKGYYCLQSTKKDFRLLGCAKKIKICAKNEMTTY